MSMMILFAKKMSMMILFARYGHIIGWKASDNEAAEDVLIQFWEVNSSNPNEDGRKYWKLKTRDKAYYIVNGSNEALWSHRIRSFHRTITIQDDDDDDDDEHKVLENDPQQIVISRVFRNKMSEWNTLKNKYPHKDCGIRSCVYIPVYKTAGDYYSGNSPCGVMEYVSTGEEYPGKFRLYGLTSSFDKFFLVKIFSSLPNIFGCFAVDTLKEESSIKCIEDLINEGNTEEIDHSALETTLEVAIKHKEHTVAADTVDELVEEPPIVDIGNNMEVRYTMNAASQISNFEPTISFPQQVEEETMVLDTLAQNSRNILVTENDDTTIPVVNKTCQEVHTSKREIKPPQDISFESLREHFGRPLDDAAASFGVSRSTLKRICRGDGIKRWQYGKRTMGGNIPLYLRREVDDEDTSRRIIYRSGLSSKVVAHTSQHLNKMTVKATYSGITIRFGLTDLSGIAELEDNVIERLHLERRSFSIKYQDDEDDWILIACDKDVKECMEISRSLKQTTIKMSIDPPINNHQAP